MGYFLRFLLLLVLLITIYSILFHYIMHYENQEHSWLTGLYWTLTVMSTLGFGDITFTSDLGRAFSIVVLLSGVIFLLVMLPFAFIQYVYSPWLEAQKKRSVPRILSSAIKDHIILIGLDPVTLNLARRLEHNGFYCVLLAPDVQTSLDLEDQSYHVAAGDYDDGQTYRNMRVGEASMLLALDTDIRNSNIIFSAREADARVPIVGKAENADAVDILELAGATRVFQFRKLLGEALARRVIGNNFDGSNTGRSSELTSYLSLVIAEAPITGTSLVGKSIRNSGIRARFGINIVGIWERGHFCLPAPDSVLADSAVLVMAGTREQFNAFDQAIEQENRGGSEERILVLGGGKVGFSAAKALHDRGISVTVVDKSLKTLPDSIPFVRGDASDLTILEEAGIRSATSVIITTHDDDTNIYLTIYCRRLRPEIQIISRASLDRNVGILHGAGADIVLSVVSLMTNMVVNMLAPGKVFMINEGLIMFRSPIGKHLQGKTLLESGIRSLTRCNVVALRRKDGQVEVNPEPAHIFLEGEEIYLIGDMEAQNAFSEKFGKGNF